MAGLSTIPQSPQVFLGRHPNGPSRQDWSIYFRNTPNKDKGGCSVQMLGEARPSSNWLMDKQQSLMGHVGPEYAFNHRLERRTPTRMIRDQLLRQTDIDTYAPGVSLWLGASSTTRPSLIVPGHGRLGTRVIMSVGPWLPLPVAMMRTQVSLCIPPTTSKLAVKYGNYIFNDRRWTDWTWPISLRLYMQWP